MGLKHERVTEQIIGAAFEVHRVLGYGFLEAVYHGAMFVELSKRGVKAETEPKIPVTYKNVVVGEYRADLFVENSVIVELKAAKEYCSADEAQLINELRGIGVEVGLLINFGREKVEFKRMVV